MEASPANDRATVEPLLETIAMELNGGTVSDDLPAADANMQDRREDPDLSASALQKISSDIVARQVFDWIDDRLYSAILRSLEQTHCARMWCYMSD